jgi:hypothetical protein
MDITEIIIVKSDFRKEYFCKSCHQLRLCLDSTQTSCGNCTSTDLIWGELGELDKDKLIKENAPTSI